MVPSFAKGGRGIFYATECKSPLVPLFQRGKTEKLVVGLYFQVLWACAST